MPLTSTTTLDVVNATNTITFYESATQVDQIVYSGNAITFKAISAYNLSKSDLLLYFQFLNTFSNVLNINFPVTNASSGAAWPLSVFDITINNLGVKKLIYTQNSQGSNVTTIT